MKYKTQTNIKRSKAQESIKGGICSRFFAFKKILSIFATITNKQ